MIPLSTLEAAWVVIVPLVDEVPDPADVKPGWLGFSVFLLLVAAVVFLAFSFRKQLKKVDFEEDPDGAGPSGDEADGDGTPSRS